MRKAQLLAVTLTSAALLLPAPSAFADPLSTRCDGVTGGCLTTTPEESPTKKGKGKG